MIIRGKLVLKALLLNWVCVLVFMAISMANNEEPCDYDQDKPSLKSALKSYKALDYRCAKYELYDFLRLSSISELDRADAHIWLGITYYRILKGRIEQYDSVLTHFVAALESFAGYRGEIEKDTTELGNIFKSAKDSLSKIVQWREIRKQDSIKSLCLKYESDIKRRRVKIILTGIGIAGATIGTLLYNASADDAYDRYRSSVSPIDIKSAWDDYISKKNWRNVMIGTTTAFVLAEIFWIIDKPRRPESDCAPFYVNYRLEKIGKSGNAIGLKATFCLSFL